MPKQVPWELMGEPVQLDARDDLARVPPLLTGFTHFCWRQFLVLHDVYVENRRLEEMRSIGGYVGTFRCSSCAGCFANRKTCVEYQARLSNRQISFYKRSDRQHGGESRSVLGLTVPQWKVLGDTEPKSVEAAVLEFQKRGVPSPGRRLLQSHLGIASEDLATRQITMSAGSLLQFLESRSREKLQAAGLLRPGTCVCMRFQGVDPASKDVFMAAVTQERWMSKCERISSDMPGLDVSADGKHKHTRRQLLCVALQPEEPEDCDSQSEDGAQGMESEDADQRGAEEAAPQGPRAKAKGRPAGATKPKTDALLTLVYGYATSHYARGAVEKRKGGIMKNRQTFNPLCLCFVLCGEGEIPYQFGMDSVVAYAERYHPAVATRLQSVSSACSDFTSGCQNAYRTVHGAEFCDQYVCDEGVWKASGKCLLAGCEEHALDNLCSSGKTGISKLRRRHGLSKAEIAASLRKRLVFMHRRLEIVLFDMAVFYSLRELDSGSIPYLGKQRRWSRYYDAWYLFKEAVGDVSLHNAIWRSGTDRCKPRSSDNSTESYHNKVVSKVAQVAKAVPGMARNARPSFPEFLKRFESAFDIDEELRGDAQEAEVYVRWPVEVDPNLLNGHPSIVRHTSRLSCREYLSGNRMGNADYIYQEDHGPWRYLVMSAGCSSERRHEPAQVDAREASFFISLLRLPPAEDRHEAFLTANGIIRNGHFSMRAFSSYWDKYAVVRVDTRLLEAALTSPHNWAKAVVCATACDEYLNARQCEHCVVGRCLCGDPKANPFPSALTTAAAVDGQRGAPGKRVLGHCRQSEDAAEAQEKARPTKIPRRAAQKSESDVAPSPPRNAAEEIEAAAAQAQYDAMYQASVALCKVPVEDQVRVPRAEGSELVLCKSPRALELLRQMYLLMQQAGVYYHRFEWKHMTNSLKLVGLFRAYQSHPVSSVSARASEALDLLRMLVSRQACGHASAVPVSGVSRCAGQEAFPAVSIPETCFEAVRACCRVQQRPFVLLLLGRRVEPGYLVTTVLQPSVRVDSEHRVVIFEPSVCLEFAETHRLVLLGIAFCRALPPLPLESDLEEFAAWGACPGGARCNICMAANSQTQRLYTLPAQAQQKDSRGLAARLQLCTFVNLVNDGQPSSYCAPRRLGGHILESEVPCVSPLRSYQRWVPLYAPALRHFVMKGAAYQPGHRWDMFALMCAVASLAYKRYGADWCTKVLMAWPSDLATAPGSIASPRTLAALHKMAPQFEVCVVPLSTESHWAGLVIRRPADGRVFWDVAILDSQHSEKMRDIAQVSLEQVKETLDLPALSPGKGFLLVWESPGCSPPSPLPPLSLPRINLLIFGFCWVSGLSPYFSSAHPGNPRYPAQ